MVCNVYVVEVGTAKTKDVYFKARPFQRKKDIFTFNNCFTSLLTKNSTKTRFKDVKPTSLLLAKGTSPGSLPNPPGTVRPVARPGVQRRTVAAPPSTRAWGVSVIWVEWWIRMALNG